MKPCKRRTLTSFPTGSTVKVCGLCENRSERARACALGITPGTCVRVLSRDNGCCRIQVRGADLVLGERMAEGILAETLPDTPDPAQPVQP